MEGDLVERVVGPGVCVECASLGLYWVVSEDSELGQLLRLSRDAAGRDLLPIEAAEAKYRASEAARRASDAERDAALERVRVLEQELLKRR